MKILLLGLEFNIGNLGCEALAYSFVSFLNKIAEEMSINIEYKALVYKDKPMPNIPNTKIEVECIKIKTKKISFWTHAYKCCKESDLFFDFTMGDSFSDIYGHKRYFFMTFLKQLACWSKTPFILGPQTYGPFKNLYAKKWSKKIILHADEVFSRDEMSAKYVRELTGRLVNVTTDVAFALPTYKADIQFEYSKINIGFNPSGLLWNGGYTGNNQFELTLDYKKYCEDILDYYCKRDEYQIYLIPHVGNPDGLKEIDNDFNACRVLKEKYPNTIFIDGKKSAMEIKGIISEMDVFIGARMHATIGAFSSGVATIPVSYSRKFEGLYDNLNYKYVISASKIDNTDATEQTIKYVNDYEILKKHVEDSLQDVYSMQDEFRDKIKKLIKTV